MLTEIQRQLNSSDYDFRAIANPQDTLSHLFEDWVPYYRLKRAIAAAIKPETILEIGVRFGYSAHAFLSGSPAARLIGVDLDVNTFGGESGAVGWAAQILPEEQCELIIGNSQLMQELPGGIHDLIHVDGQQDGASTFHDLVLSSRQGRFILVDGYMWTQDNFAGTNEFLWKFKEDIEWSTMISGYAGELLIKIKDSVLKKPSGAKVEGSAAIVDLYDETYYRSNCGGWEFYEQAARRTFEDGRIRSMIDLLHRQPAARVLDLGCGRGEIAIFAASQGAEVTAIDYSQAAIDILEDACAELTELPGTIHAIKGDATTFNDGRKYDAILAGDLVEHLAPSELDRLYTNAAELLAPNGQLILHTFPNRWNYDYAMPRLRRRIESGGGSFEVNPRSRYELLMHINEQNPRLMRRQIRQHFAHVEMWFGSPEDPAGSLHKHCSPQELAEFRDIYCVAGHQPINRTTLKEPFLAHELTGVSVNLTAMGVPDTMKTSESLQITVCLDNPSQSWLTTRGANPVFISYQWRDADGNPLDEEGWRNPLVPSLGPGRSALYQVRIVSPNRPGRHQLNISTLQEHRFWIPTDSKDSIHSFTIDIQ